MRGLVTCLAGGPKGSYWDMEPLAIIIFMGIPAVAVLVGLVVIFGTMVRWRTTLPPSGHYIASRTKRQDDDPANEVWLRELDALQLPYRHTVC